MAHSGKNYPLAFRRDLASDLNTYRGGLAIAYRASMLNVVGTIAAAFNSSKRILIELAPPNSPIAEWTTGPQIINGRTVTCTLRFDKPRYDSKRAGTFRIDDQAKGNCLTVELHAQGAFPYNVLTSSLPNVEIPQPALLAWVPNFSSVSLGALSWALWNSM